MILNWRCSLSIILYAGRKTMHKPPAQACPLAYNYIFTKYIYLDVCCCSLFIRLMILAYKLSEQTVFHNLKLTLAQPGSLYFYCKRIIHHFYTQYIFFIYLNIIAIFITLFVQLQTISHLTLFYYFIYSNGTLLCGYKYISIIQIGLCLICAPCSLHSSLICNRNLFAL